MLFSQIIPPSPSPTESKSLLFMSVSPLLPCMQDHWYYLLIPYNWTELICANIWYLSFSFWLTSLCVIGSSFVRLIRMDSNAFLSYGWEIFHCVYGFLRVCVYIYIYSYQEPQEALPSGPFAWLHFCTRILPHFPFCEVSNCSKNLIGSRFLDYHRFSDGIFFPPTAIYHGGDGQLYDAIDLP